MVILLWYTSAFSEVIYANYYAKILDWNFRLVNENSQILVVVFVSKFNLFLDFVSTTKTAEFSSSSSSLWRKLIYFRQRKFSFDEKSTDIELQFSLTGDQIGNELRLNRAQQIGSCAMPRRLLSSCSCRQWAETEIARSIGRSSGRDCLVSDSSHSHAGDSDSSGNATYSKHIQRKTDTHPFNGLFSRIIWISRNQKVRPFWILMKHEMTGWQWHQLDHMQIICTSLQIDNHTSTSSLSLYRLDALPAAQPTVSKHWRRTRWTQITENNLSIHLQSNSVFQKDLG